MKKYIDGEEKTKEDRKDVYFTSKRILLAEDNELNYEIAFDILSEVGFEIDWAEKWTNLCR